MTNLWWVFLCGVLGGSACLKHLPRSRKVMRGTFCGEYRQKIIFASGSLFQGAPLLKKLVFSAIVFSSLFTLSIAQAQQPPIIDRQLFFGEIQIAGAQISPDGQWQSFLSPIRARKISGLRKRLIH